MKKTIGALIGLTFATAVAAVPSTTTTTKTPIGTAPHPMLTGAEACRKLATMCEAGDANGCGHWLAHCAGK